MRGIGVRTLRLDGTRFGDLDGFFNEAERVLTHGLDWPVAHNLDALNDILYGGFGAHRAGEAVRLRWANSAKSRRDLGWPATVAYWKRKVITFHPNQRHRAEAALAAAEREAGQTLYDLIVEIIRDHPNIAFEEA